MADYDLSTGEWTTYDYNPVFGGEYVSIIDPSDYENINEYTDDIYNQFQGYLDSLMQGPVGGDFGHLIGQTPEYDTTKAFSEWMSQVPFYNKIAADTVKGDAARAQALEQSKRNAAEIASTYAGMGAGAGRSGAQAAASAYGSMMPVMQAETQLDQMRTALAQALMGQGFGIASEQNMFGRQDLRAQQQLQLQDLLSQRDQQTALQTALLEILGGYGDPTYVAPTMAEQNTFGDDLTEIGGFGLDMYGAFG
jgi:hypothetical protein